jgi:hypothetical protein
MEAVTRTEARMEVATRTEADGGGDGADRGGDPDGDGDPDGGADGDRGGDPDRGADGGGDNDGGGDPDGGGDLDGDASVYGGCRDAGPVDRTGPDHGATGAQARRRLLQLTASYPHRLLRLASSRGDESRENEIEFCVREERERERDKKRGKIRFVIMGVTGPELVVVVKIRLWWDRDFGLHASRPNF